MRMVALMLTLLVTASTATKSVAEITWQNDLKKAHMQAQALGKPLLLHFYTDNCIYCDKLEAGAFQNRDVQDTISKGFVPVKIHAGKQPKLAAMFKVNRFPTDVVVTTDGDAMSHRVSPQKAGDYVQMLAACAVHPAARSAIAGVQPAAPTMPAPKPAAAKSDIPSYASSNQFATKPPAVSAPNRNTASDGTVAQTAATQSPGVPLPQFEHPIAAQAVSAQVATPPAGMALPPRMGTPQPTAKPQSSVTSQANTKPKTASRTVPSNADMELSMDGYCSVSLLNDSEWVRGKPELGVVHLGKLYLFANESARASFIANPIVYTPMLNGIDVVRFFEEHRIVPGKREHCVIDPDHNRIYMFNDEAALEHFDKDFDRYLETAMAVMDKAVKESNPN